MKLLFVISMISLLFHGTTPEGIEAESITTKEGKVAKMKNEAVFHAGEKLTMKVFYNWSALWIGAGEIVFNIKEDTINGKNVYHVVVEGETYKSYELFYKVHDIYESYFDRESLFPEKFVRNVNEGGFIIDETYHFNQDNKYVDTYDYRHNPVKEESFNFSNNVLDVVSAIYFARCLDFSKYNVGDKIPFSVFIDGLVYDLYIRYEGEKDLKTKMGKFKTIMLKPLLIDNEYFDGGEEMTIYVSDDDNRLPIRVESPLTVGNVIADLKGFSGIKYDFSSRIK